jgi:hypothetical protein
MLEQKYLSKKRKIQLNTKIFTPFTQIPIQSKKISYYLSMINDSWRNRFFYDALHATAKDKVVLDVGAGTGILSAYALHAGAKFVFVVERDSAAADMAQYTLSRCFEQSRFRVINCDFWTDEIDNKIDQTVDILVSETVGPNLFDQRMCTTWHCAKPFLSSTAISIPDRLHCDLYVWHGIKNTTRIAEPKIDPFSLMNYQANLYPAELLMDDFAQALIDYDNIVDQNRDLAPKTVQQSNLKLYNIAPDTVHKDIVEVTKDTLPEMLFDQHPYPHHISTKIKFSIDITAPATIGIVNKISFLNNTLYLHDAMYMPWKYSPSLVCETLGTYEFIIDEVSGQWHYNIKKAQ